MNLIGHFRTITRHRHAVIRHCAKAGIFWQGLGHDLSKYGPAEFWRGVKYYQGTRSPNVQERLEKGYSAAWLHHKGRNRHHYEYWTDYDAKKRVVVAVKMPLRYVKEMFCDRVAASKIYKGRDYTSAHPLEYYRGGMDGRLIHPETAALLEKLLVMLRDEGEEAVFAHLRGLTDY